MKIPTQTQNFDMLYTLAAENGREQALFGDSITAVREGYAKTVLENSRSSIYLEFPLMGKPGLDFLTTYSYIPPGARFTEGGGFGYQGMAEMFSRLPYGHGYACGLELDTSTGETERAGVYFQFRRDTELIPAFLESVGGMDRLDTYMSVLGRCPEDMRPEYIEMFPGREGTPLRIGGYIRKKTSAAIGADPTFLGKQFKSIGFSSYNGEMLDFCTELIRQIPMADFQFDIWPDGSLGDTFGLSLSFNDVRPGDAAACMETGSGAQIMRLLCENKLADNRYQMIAGASQAKVFPVEDENGGLIPLALIIRLNYAKVKFRAGVPRLAKFYYMACARLIDK
jgi:hypothetical protein